MTSMSLGVSTGPSEEITHSPPAVPMKSCRPGASQRIALTLVAAMVKSRASSSWTSTVPPSRLSGRMFSMSADWESQKVWDWLRVLAAAKRCSKKVTVEGKPVVSDQAPRAQSTAAVVAAKARRTSTRTSMSETTSAMTP